MQKSIAFDLHGTLDSSKEIFNLFLNLVTTTNHKVYILSGSPASEISDSLGELLEQNSTINKAYVMSSVSILSVVDTCKFFNIPIIRALKNGKMNWYCDEELWWPMKSIICKSNNIDFLVDDKIQYKAFFGDTHPTKFYFIKNRHLYVNSKKIAFNNLFLNNNNIFK